VIALQLAVTEPAVGQELESSSRAACDAGGSGSWPPVGQVRGAALAADLAAEVTVGGRVGRPPGVDVVGG
jgi:hypothetical protein